MSNLSFQTIKNALETSFLDLGYSNELINQLLTDNFVNELVSICSNYNNQYNGNIFSALERFENNATLLNGKSFCDAFSKEIKSNGVVKDIIDCMKDNVNQLDTASPAFLSTYRAEIIIDKKALLLYGGLCVLALLAGGPMGLLTVQLGVGLAANTFLELNANGDLVYIEDRFIKNINGRFAVGFTAASPLIVDLDGDGVETVGTGSGVYFDHDNNGFAENSGWVGKDDGILVRDLNNNGEINDGTELFGNNSVLSNGEKAANGFEALKELDSNHDGVFNSQDTDWNSVKVWKDANGNGSVDDGELLTLEQAGIAGINLGYADVGQETTDGNTIGQSGTIIKTDGTTGEIKDIWFDTDGANTIDLSNVAIPDDIRELPELAGFGNVHSLQTAMALDTTGELKTLVQQFAAAASAEQRSQILDNLIYHWAGVQDVDPNSRRPTPDYENVLGDARKLEALEEFLGEEFLGVWCWGEKTPNPHRQAAPYILQAYDELKSSFDSQLLAQTHFKDIIDNIILTYNTDSQDWTIDVSGAVELLRARFEASDSGRVMLAEFASAVRVFTDFSDDVFAAFAAAGSTTGTEFEQFLIDLNDLSKIGTNGDDTLYGDDKDDYLAGQYGHDNIYGRGGDDILDGGAGDDQIWGGDGDDTLTGGSGDDYLHGGNGADTYIFNPGFGHDRLDNTDDDASAENPDIIRFGEGILPSRTSLQRDGYDLIITVTYEDETLPADSVRVYSYFDKMGTTSATVNNIIFADGTIWDYAYVRDNWQSVSGAGVGITVEGDDNANAINGSPYDDILLGNGGDDTFNGDAGNDVYVGGTGNDSIIDGAGNDTYIWNLGDGLDTISDGANQDKIVFGPGIRLSDLSFRCVNNEDLQIIVKGDESQGIIIRIGIRNMNYRIEDIYFDDGSVFHLGDSKLVLEQLENSETIYLTEHGDTVYAKGGDDVINGGDGDDVIDAGDGNDTITAGGGNDLLIGGKGDDNINAGGGNDTFVWNLGDGQDTISGDVNGNNKVIFGEGISFSDLTFRQTSLQGLQIIVNGNPDQGIVDQGRCLKELQFADGSVFKFAEGTIDYHQGDGSEYITVKGNWSNIYTGDGDKQIEDYNGGNRNYYTGSGNDNINARGGNHIISAGKGDDIISADIGNDTYIYNLGDGLDKISDSGGDNKILFGPGITLADLSFRKMANQGLRIMVGGDETQGIIDEMGKIGKLQFADGSVADVSQLPLTFYQTDGSETIKLTDGGVTVYAGAGNDTVEDGAGDDTIYGGAGSDTITVRYGNNTVIGGTGNDTLTGGDGNDTYVWNLGDGFDTLYDTTGSNKIVFGDGISESDLTFVRQGSALHIYVKGDVRSGLGLRDFFSTFGGQTFLLEFSSGETKEISTVGMEVSEMPGIGTTIEGTVDDLFLTGTDGHDIIKAKDNGCVITGNKGDDILQGGRGNDTYVWNLGDGMDTIDDSSGNGDKIKFGSGISMENLTFYNDNDSLIILVNGDETQGLLIKNHFLNSKYRIEHLEFADGSVYDLTANGLPLHMRQSDSELKGTEFSDTIYGSVGNDRINVVAGSNTVYGGDGNDTIDASRCNSSESNVISGDKGNDIISGGSGNDVYVWNLGDGFDRITDDNSSSKDDRVRFGTGISMENLTFYSDNGGLIIIVNGDESQGIRIDRQLNGSHLPIDKLEFADGSVYDLSTQGLTLHALEGAASVTGTQNDDIFYGTSGRDNIITGGGSNRVYAGDGNDIIDATGKGSNESGHQNLIVGGKGDDVITGGNGDDTYVWNLGDGFDRITDSGISSNNDRIRFGEGITLDDLSFRNDNGSLIINVDGDETQGMMVKNHFSGSNNKIEYLEFANGSEVSVDNALQLVQALSSFSPLETSGQDLSNLAAPGVEEMYSLACSPLERKEAC